MNLFMGDSHILALKKFNNTNNHIVKFRAASIRGLVNENSISKTRSKIFKLINKNNYENLFIMFGKVDLEWIYPYKKNKDSKIVMNHFIEETINKYLIFLNELSPKFNKIIVMGIHLPSLHSEDMIKCINNEYLMNKISKLSNIGVNKDKILLLDSLEKRTQYTILFNKILQTKIENEISDNFKYIDITDELLDSSNNLCKKKFIIDNNHHLLREPVGNIWFNKHLKKFL